MPIYTIIFALAYSQSVRRPGKFFSHKSFTLTNSELDALEKNDTEGLSKIEHRQKIIYTLIIVFSVLFFIYQFLT